MYHQLGIGALKGGESCEVGYVEGPDPEWMNRLIPFLGHKEPWYEYHIAKALSENLDGLRTRFYIGQVDGQIIAHIMVASARGVGILGHVYTLPEWRRRGALSLLMKAQMRDVEELPLDVVTLSTGFGSAAYGIYAHFGFRSVADGSGHMVWSSGSAAAEKFFAHGPCTVHPMRWDDWPAYSWATLQPVDPAEPRPRSAAFGISGRGSSEGPFVWLMQSALGRRSTHLILRSATGAVTGWCHLVPAPVPLSRAWILDLHALPGFEAYLPQLLEQVEWPGEPVACALTAPPAAYLDALSAHGFGPDPVLEKAARSVGSPSDVDIFLRPQSGEE